ncbi:MAG: ribonuclease III [Bacteroidetes bacterium SW_9_63_38]|nr:MAG: ribonuclease III [Bacteroidetes bacterium SW_9_63_38]
MDDVSRAAVEALTGQPIHQPDLYRRALTHRSLLRTDEDRSLRSNERLEFLGDALLDLIVSKALYERFPTKNEGELTRIRAKLVSGAALAQYARRMDLGKHILMSENAAHTEGRNNPNILADAFEALTAALYLDHDYDAAARFVHERALAPFDLDDIAARDENYKSQLLERMQADGRPQPTYRVVREKGPSHDKRFTVVAVIGDTPHEKGTAGSKQDAEQEAARRTLEQLDAPASSE